MPPLMILLFVGSLVTVCLLKKFGYIRGRSRTTVRIGPHGALQPHLAPGYIGAGQPGMVRITPGMQPGHMPPGQMPLGSQVAPGYVQPGSNVHQGYVQPGASVPPGYMQPGSGMPPGYAPQGQMAPGPYAPPPSYGHPESKTPASEMTPQAHNTTPSSHGQGSHMPMPIPAPVMQGDPQTPPPSYQDSKTYNSDPAYPPQ